MANEMKVESKVIAFEIKRKVKKLQEFDEMNKYLPKDQSANLPVKEKSPIINTEKVPIEKFTVKVFLQSEIEKDGYDYKTLPISNTTTAADLLAISLKKYKLLPSKYKLFAVTDDEKSNTETFLKDEIQLKDDEIIMEIQKKFKDNGKKVKFVLNHLTIKRISLESPISLKDIQQINFSASVAAVSASSTDNTAHTDPKMAVVWAVIVQNYSATNCDEISVKIGEIYQIKAENQTVCSLQTPNKLSFGSVPLFCAVKCKSEKPSVFSEPISAFVVKSNAINSDLLKIGIGDSVDVLGFTTKHWICKKGSEYGLSDLKSLVRVGMMKVAENSDPSDIVNTDKSVRQNGMSKSIGSVENSQSLRQKIGRQSITMMKSESIQSIRKKSNPNSVLNSPNSSQLILNSPQSQSYSTLSGNQSPLNPSPKQSFTQKSPLSSPAITHNGSRNAHSPSQFTNRKKSAPLFYSSSGSNNTSNSSIDVIITTNPPKNTAIQTNDILSKSSSAISLFKKSKSKSKIEFNTNTNNTNGKKSVDFTNNFEYQQPIQKKRNLSLSTSGIFSSFRKKSESAASLPLTPTSPETFSATKTAPIKPSIPANCPIIPYSELADSNREARMGLNEEHLEWYLSKEDCLEYLGVSKSELRFIPQWKLDERKERAGLIVKK